MRRRITFPEGTAVTGLSLSERCEDDPGRDYGLYLDAAWRPTWPGEVVDNWPDFGVPQDQEATAGVIYRVFTRAQLGNRIEVGCRGGQGRTGTVLSCMAILAGVDVSKAVEWVRTHYCAEAVEESCQEAWVTWFGENATRIIAGKFVWCTLRNLVHTVYREIRHIGPEGDDDAKLVVTDGVPVGSAKRCRASRTRLKGTGLFRKGKTASSVSDVMRPYFEVTGLEPKDLVELFARPEWRSSYGGEKWATITKHLITLIDAVEARDHDRAHDLAASTASLEHNSAKLVPSLSDWRRTPYLREKWPQMCRDG